MQGPDQTCGQSTYIQADTRQGPDQMTGPAGSIMDGSIKGYKAVTGKGVSKWGRR